MWRGQGMGKCLVFMALTVTEGSFKRVGPLQSLNMNKHLKGISKHYY